MSRAPFGELGVVCWRIGREWGSVFHLEPKDELKSTKEAA